MFHHRKNAPALLLSGLFGICALMCGSSGTAPARVSFHASHARINPGDSVTIAIVVDLARGWHTYWFNPGDAGLAPQVVWTLPEGWTASTLRLPVPERIGESGGVAFGYTGRMAFVASLYSPSGIQTDADIRIGAQVNLLVCKDECVPFSGSAVIRIATVLQDKARAQGSGNRIVESAISALPADQPILHGSWHHTGERGVEIRIPRSQLPEFLSAGQFFPLTSGLFDYSEKPVISDSKSTVTVSLWLASLRTGDPDTLTGLLAGTPSKNSNQSAALWLRAIPGGVP